jgi:uncharacterized SAM-binding protein YcdF (DUF218 family)
MTSRKDSKEKLFGLVTRRERWGLSWRGWLTGIAIFLLTAILWVFNVRPFLAPTERMDTKILVVEGWVHPFTINAAVKEFQTGHYETIYTTGGPVVGSGGYVNDFNTSASVGADLLLKAGMPENRVQMVPSRISGRDRTYSSALALREWFRAHGRAVTRFNVLTEDVHARRTQLLFQKAFGRETAVGIVSARDPDYDPAHWWRYSEGVREILGESIAYLYARFLFHPDAPQVP